MSASFSFTLQVRVTTQKGDIVAVTGSHKVLGEWNPYKVRYMKPMKSLHDGNIWSLKLDVPLNCNGLEYRYMVVRRIASCGEDDGDDVYVIRHWEAGVFARFRKIVDIGIEPKIDTYGVFDPERKMFIDQGWLLDETEVQLRFYKDPILMFKKRDKATSYNVKCSTVNLLHYDFPADSDSNRHSLDENFDRMTHASNPLIRVTSLGNYNNKEQSTYGMAVSSKDYLIYKLRTLEPECHGIKIDFYTSVTTPSEKHPEHLGYANLLPMHLAEGTGSTTLAINNTHGFPIGQVAVRYLVCKPTKGQLSDMSRSYTKWWKRDRPAIDIGHRGLGNTHSTDINSANQNEQNLKHENTLGSLVTAGESGADYVEFDVQLSRDKVPLIWHDFKVSILLRKKRKGEHRVHHIPVHELTYSQLKDLRVDYVKTLDSDHHNDLSDTADDTAAQHNVFHAPFPTLKEALDAVDENVGFYVELKYPQIVYESKTKEEGLELYFERNEFLDPILKELYSFASTRRIVLASFDPDICILARLKQNRYPVIYLIEDMGADAKPNLHDVRTHRILTAISVATSEKFLGLSVNASALLRKEENLLEKILAESLTCFVWDNNTNNAEVRKDLKARGAHAICYDEIETKGAPNIYRAEHEERLRKMLNNVKMSPGVSPCPSVSSSRGSSIIGSAPNLLELMTELENQAKTAGSSSATHLASLATLQQAYSNTNGGVKTATSDINTSPTSSSTPRIEVTDSSHSASDQSIEKAVNVSLPLDNDISRTYMPIKTSDSGKDPDLTEFY